MCIAKREGKTRSPHKYIPACSMEKLIPNQDTSVSLVTHVVSYVPDYLHVYVKKIKLWNQGIFRGFSNGFLGVETTRSVQNFQFLLRCGFVRYC